MILSTTFPGWYRYSSSFDKGEFWDKFVLAKNKVEWSWFKQCTLGDKGVPGSVISCTKWTILVGKRVVEELYTVAGMRTGAGAGRHDRKWEKSVI